MPMPYAPNSFLAAAVCAAIASLFAASTISVAHAEPKRGKASAGGPAGQIVALTNKARARNGLHPLRIDGRCVSAISGHVADMARSRFLSHAGSDGRGANESYRRYNPKSLGAGENLAYNTTGTGESFMRQWLSSSTHRGNILNARYRGIGVAVSANCSDRKATGKCTYYAGQCFSL
jgi:uncharacterized protein YkwD